jgi:hypothetical protein
MAARRTSFCARRPISSRGSPTRTIADLRGFAVESVCAVLREQGCQIIARTYRAWLSGSRPAARIHGDALVIDARRATIWQPDSLYGRRKMAVRLRRRGLPVTHGTVDRLMRELGMNSVRRARVVRTTVPGKDGRAGDLLDRNFTAPAPCAALRSRRRQSCSKWVSQSERGAERCAGARPTSPSFRWASATRAWAGSAVRRRPGPDVRVPTRWCTHPLLAQWTTDAECAAAENRSDV